MGAETHTLNTSILAVEVGGLRVQGRHLMHSEFTASLGYNLGEGVKKRERHRETWREPEHDSQQNWTIPNTSLTYWSCGPPLSPNICAEGDKAVHEPEFVLAIEPKSTPQNNELLKRLSSFYIYTEKSACNKMIADSKKHATSLYKSNFHIKWICHKQSQLQKIEMMFIFFPYSLPR